MSEVLHVLRAVFRTCLISPTIFQLVVAPPGERVAANAFAGSATLILWGPTRVRPAAQVFEQEGVRFGMCHGSNVMPLGNENALEALRRRLSVDVLLTAGTGKAEHKVKSSGLLINPGSITGACVAPQASGRASYTLMIVDSGKVCPSTLATTGHAHKTPIHSSSEVICYSDASVVPSCLPQCEQPSETATPRCAPRAFSAPR